MPNTKTIEETRQFGHENELLTISVFPGNAHLTYTRIYRNINMIAAGEGELQTSNAGEKGDQIIVKSTINKPFGTSAHATLSIAMENSSHSQTFPFTSHEPDFDEVIYKVIITLI